MALLDFERLIGGADFKKFSDRWVEDYKAALREYISPLTKRPLAINSRISKMRSVRFFLLYLSEQAGYRSRIKRVHVDAFTPTLNDKRAAREGRRRYPPTLGQLETILRLYPTKTLSERRYRAVVAFVCLTAERGASVAAIKIGDVDLHNRTAFFSGEGGCAKFGKGYTADFFPMPDVFESVLMDCVTCLQRDLKFSPDDPLFPSLRTERAHSAAVATKSVTRGSTIIRKAFKLGCKVAEMSAFTPHEVRSSIVAHMAKSCETIEEHRAVSRSMGHNQLRTTEGYAPRLSDERQAELMGRLRARMVEEAE